MPVVLSPLSRKLVNRSVGLNKDSSSTSEKPSANSFQENKRNVSLPPERDAGLCEQIQPGSRASNAWNKLKAQSPYLSSYSASSHLASARRHCFGRQLYFLLRAHLCQLQFLVLTGSGRQRWEVWPLFSNLSSVVQETSRSADLYISLWILYTMIGQV